MAEPAELRRVLGTAALTLYGVGVIVGAGIFVLVGEVAGEAGAASWFAFLGASLAALPTGLAYAELASRHPQSAGEAVFAARATARPFVAFVVGFLVVASGLMSTAAVSHGFVQYARVAFDVPSIPSAVLLVGFLGALSFLNARGMRESTWVNGVCTVASILALVGLVIAGASHLGDAAPQLLEAPSRVPAAAILSAGALAFYAFIGFEDICNVADETRQPSRTIPRAILLSLAISTALYVLVTLTALSVVSADDLAAHSAPLALVSERLLPGISSRWLAGVAVLAVINTALFNLIMASRVLYGMARNGWLPAALGKVGHRRRTPLRAVALSFVLAVAFALTGLLGVLAQATNVLILLAFAAVNLSLVVIRVRKVPPDPDAGRVFRLPIVVPILGVLFTGVMLTQLSAGAWLRAAGLLIVGILAHLVVRRRPGLRGDGAGLGHAL
jgi:amino acid transporter